MIEQRRVYLAEMLLGKQLITQAQMDQALEIQKKSGKKLGQILVEENYISEKVLLQVLSEQLKLPYIDVANLSFDPLVVKLLPEFQARQYRALVLFKEEGAFVVGMVDPQNIIARDEIQKILGGIVKYALVSESDLVEVLDSLYRRTDDISYFAETLSSEIGKRTIAEKEDADVNADAPVLRLLDSIFADAVQVGASDIHIESGENQLYLRMRVDGLLQEQIIPEAGVASALVQRIKLMANLNIAEKRLPQDGRLSINVQGQKLDVRVSTIPAQFGESMVMRLLNQSVALVSIRELGMESHVFDVFQHIIKSTYGLLLIVGPTGSGKTTTLYSVLNNLNLPEKKLVTIEDPVEYRIPRINQVQTHASIDLTFARILRAVLRQDPDVVMVGELRDQETVQIALRAAMTGHFVLSTLHTYDTVSTVVRLMDMGAPSYLIASVLKGVLAQRLVRRNCQQCVQSVPLTDFERQWLKAQMGEDAISHDFKRGKGCLHCHQTGFRGRVGVFEFLQIDENALQALRKNSTEDLYEATKKQASFQTLLESAFALAKRGMTAISEVINMRGEM